LFTQQIIGKLPGHAVVARVLGADVVFVEINLWTGGRWPNIFRQEITD